MSKDNINPEHYAFGGIQPWEYLKMKLSPEALKGFYIGNVIKYVSRADKKDKVEDFKKAKWYLEKIIEDMETEEKSTNKIISNVYIEHDGKSRPTNGSKYVEILCRNGATIGGMASAFEWLNDNLPTDIVGYKIINKEKENVK